MHEQTITVSHIWIVEILAKHDYFKNFHLVGGTALALHIGHRLSEDLDFFTESNFDFSELVKILKTLFESKVLNIDESRRKIEIQGIKVDFVFWALPIKYDFITWRGIKVMDPRDIAMHKLFAMVGRNVKKDLADIYFIDQEIRKIEEVFQDFREINRDGDYDVLGSLRILFDETSIQQSPEPVMICEYDFDQALIYVKEKLRQIIIKDLQLSKYLQQN